MILFYTIIFKVGIMHCCLYVTFSIFFLMDGVVRLGFGAFFLPRARRKGIYFAICASSALFLITVILYDNNADGRYNLVKLVTGVLAKFTVTVYFAFAYTTLSELHPTGIRQRATALQM